MTVTSAKIITSRTIKLLVRVVAACMAGYAIPADAHFLMVTGGDRLMVALPRPVGVGGAAPSAAELNALASAEIRGDRWTFPGVFDLTFGYSKEANVVAVWKVEAHT